MALTRAQLKEIVHRHLDGKGSSLFVQRVEGAIDQAGDDPDQIRAAIDRVSKMLELFVGKREAQAVRDEAAPILRQLAA